MRQPRSAFGGTGSAGVAAGGEDLLHGLQGRAGGVQLDESRLGTVDRHPRPEHEGPLHLGQGVLVAALGLERDPDGRLLLAGRQPAYQARLF